MSEIEQDQSAHVGISDTRWTDLYKVGAITGVIFSTMIVLAVIAYFIWPYTPGLASVADIFANLQSDRLGGWYLSIY